MNKAVNVSKLIPAPTVAGLKLPSPSSALIEAKQRKDELQAQRAALTADQDKDSQGIREDIKALSAASKEEQDLLRKVAMEPDNKAYREALDTLRGTVLVTKDSLKNRKDLNSSRVELIAELNMEMAGAIKRFKSCTNNYYRELHNSLEKQLLDEIIPPLEQLGALRLLCGMDPRGGVLSNLDNVDRVANEIRKTISASYGI